MASLIGLFLIPQSLLARDVVDASSCVTHNLGIFSYTTGQVIIDSYDDITGAHTGTRTESCGGFKWFWQPRTNSIQP